MPALSSTGLSFRPNSLATWIHQLRSLSSVESNSSYNGTDKALPTAAADPDQNPATKLIAFFEEAFQTDKGAGGNGIEFETEETEKLAPALRQSPLIIESGLSRKVVGVGIERWKEE